MPQHLAVLCHPQTQILLSGGLDKFIFMVLCYQWFPITFTTGMVSFKMADEISQKSHGLASVNIANRLLGDAT